MAGNKQSEPPVRLGLLQPAPGARHGRRRVGRGTSSGRGKTAGRGHKGQKSRSGGVKRPGFEGGQTPIYRRLPKLRGFKNILFTKEFDIVNLSQIAARPDVPSTLGPTELATLGLTRGERRVKILGGGDLAQPLTISAHAFSESARKKIEGAGGKVEVLAK